MAPQPLKVAGADPTSGRTVAWSGGMFAGDKKLVAACHQLAEDGTVVEVTPTGPFVPADPDDPVAVIGMIRAVCGPRARMRVTGRDRRVDEALAVPDGGVA